MPTKKYTSRKLRESIVNDDVKKRRIRSVASDPGQQIPRNNYLRVKNVFGVCFFPFQVKPIHLRGGLGTFHKKKKSKKLHEIATSK